MNKLLKILSVSTLLLAFFQGAQADQLADPAGEVVLTITGDIDNTQDGKSARLDLAQLRQLPGNTFDIQTYWSDSVHRYQGPLLSAVLDHVGAKGSELELIALNDYTVTIEADYIKQYQPILAFSEDGKLLSVREKGPLWLLLPVHLHPELNEGQHNRRMIWQLNRIDVH